MSTAEKGVIRIIDKPAELAALRDPWNELAGEGRAHLPFLSFDWFDVWLKHFLEQDRLLVVLLYTDGRLSAIAPCVLRAGRFKRTRVRRIELMGNAYSPFRYFVLGAGSRETYVGRLALILSAMSKAEVSWDMMEFSGLPEENGLFAVVKEALVAAKLRPMEYDDFGDWYVDNIGVTGDEYLAALPGKIRKDIAYCRRRLEKLGRLEFRLIENREAVQAHMQMYYDVYAKSWQKTERVGPTFHRDLAHAAASQGWLRLGFLFLDGIPISSQFWIACRKTSYILKTIYDQSFKKYSPGKLLTAEMMKYAIDVDNVTSVDYVQGDEPYKRDWTPMRRQRKGLRVFNNNIKGRCLGLLMREILPFLNKQDVFQRPKRLIKRVLS